MQKFAKLVRKLDYDFVNRDFLELALTHRSRAPDNYERLEFLGDSILGFVIAEWLYNEFPELSEGKLSRMRASLVRKETLADVARSLDLSEHLILGEGEMKSGGFNRASILSDAIESLIGAIYLDSDLSQSKKFILDKFAVQLNAISSESTFKDPKSRLQEAMQKQGLDLPEYQILESSGQQHKQQFSVECRLPGLQLSAQATASSRRSAEQTAAGTLLKQLAEMKAVKAKSKNINSESARKKKSTARKKTVRRTG